MKIYELISRLQLLDPEQEVWFAGPTWGSHDYDWCFNLDILHEDGVIKLIGTDHE